MFRRMNAAITHHRMLPVIDKVFAFGSALDAFKHLESASHFGKLVAYLNQAQTRWKLDRFLQPNLRIQ
jgi:hypothetical protein